MADRWKIRRPLNWVARAENLASHHTHDVGEILAAINKHADKFSTEWQLILCIAPTDPAQTGSSPDNSLTLTIERKKSEHGSHTIYASIVSGNSLPPEICDAPCECFTKGKTGSLLKGLIDSPNEGCANLLTHGPQKIGERLLREAPKSSPHFKDQKYTALALFMMEEKPGEETAEPEKFTPLVEGRVTSMSFNNKDRNFMHRHDLVAKPMVRICCHTPIEEGAPLAINHLFISRLQDHQTPNTVND